MPGLLYADHVRINDAISVRIPTVGEVCDHEDDYFTAVSTIVSTPYDMMVQLDDAGIDFTKIDAFELFCLMFGNLLAVDTSLVFGDLDLSRFKTAQNRETGAIALVDEARNLVIDKPIHDQIARTVRRILKMQKNDKQPGNEEGRRYMIKIARMNQRKARRKAKNRETTQMEDLIIGLVNTGEFPYDYESVRDISIYQFYSSLNQVAHKIKYDKTMIGYFAGTVRSEDLKPEDKTWLRSQL